MSTNGSVLTGGGAKQELAKSPTSEKPIIHYNLWGGEYYQQKEADHA